MITAPEGYNSYGDARKIEMGIRFGITSVDALDTIFVHSSPRYPPSKIEDVTDGITEGPEDYATLEHNAWILSANKKIYPNEPDIEAGFISQTISKDNKMFDSSPRLVFEFTEPQDSYGITVYFDNKVPYSWPRKLTVKFVDASDTALKTAEATPTEHKCWIDAAVKGYSKIIIEVTETLIPHRRARIMEVIFGMVAEYNNDTIKSAEELQECDIYAERLPISTLTATIDNSEGLYDLINPSGAYEFLQNGQYAEYWYSIDGVKLSRGKKYFVKAETDSDGLTATIEFDDEAYFLDTVQYNDGTSGTWTLETAIESILEKSPVPLSVKYDSDSLKARNIRKCIPQETNLRDALIMCAQAAMCSAYVNTQSTLYIFDPSQRPTTAAESLTRDRIASEPTISVGDKYNTIVVKRSDSYAENEDETYTLSEAEKDEAELTKEVNNPLISDLKAWAAWGLSLAKRRVSLKTTYRGNPQVEVGDEVKIYDKFGANQNGTVETHKLSFDGGLAAAIEVRI